MLRRNPWLVVGLSALGLVGILVAAGAGYWRYANQVPVYPRPSVVMPVPNAYLDYRLAGTMSKAVGGAAVWVPAPAVDPTVAPGGTGPPGSPVLRGNGRPMVGYEEDVPLEQVRAVVARNKPALARLRQGFGKEYRNPAVTSFKQTFPELATFRELGRVLVTKGKLAEREGRMCDAARSYLDCLRLGAEVQRGGVLIHGLVGLAIQNIGLRPLQDVTDRLDAPTALAAAREMARMEARAPTAADALALERESSTLGILEMMRETRGWQQIASMAQGGSAGGSSFGETVLVWRYRLTPKTKILDDYRAYMDAVVADARKPYYAPSTLPPAPDDPLNHLLLPVFSATKLRWAQRDAWWRITELRLAARAYQAHHGTPPASVGLLVPGYLPAAPADPFAAKPLVYRTKGSRAIVYSRGPDGDDDGGKDLGSLVDPAQNGDVVTLKNLRLR